jgi:raffinose/stachyose/melibiose transport system permease protein
MNYKEIFAVQSSFWNALKNTMIYVVVCVVGQVGLGLVFSLMLFSVPLKGSRIFRSAMYIPCILAPVVIGFLGLQLYNGRFGIVNSLLHAIGLDSWTRDWLGDGRVAIYALVALHVWQFIGYYSVIILSAAQAIPQELLEVSEVDGAVGLKKIWYVIIPLLKNTILVCLTICVAGTMKVFDQIFVMTKGGPGNATEVLGLYMYNNTFNRFRYGLGSAISIVILVSSLIMVVFPRITLEKIAQRDEI